MPNPTSRKIYTAFLDGGELGNFRFSGYSRTAQCTSFSPVILSAVEESSLMPLGLSVFIYFYLLSFIIAKRNYLYYAHTFWFPYFCYSSRFR